MNFDDYKRDRAGTVQRCCEFLGTDFDPARVSDQIHNQSDGKPRADAKVQSIRQWSIYQKLIRPLVPLEARLWLVRKLSPKAPPRPRSLPTNCIEPVFQSFEKDRAIYERLTDSVTPGASKKPPQRRDRQCQRFEIHGGNDPQLSEPSTPPSELPHDRQSPRQRAMIYLIFTGTIGLIAWILYAILSPIWRSDRTDLTRWQGLIRSRNFFLLGFIYFQLYGAAYFALLPWDFAKLLPDFPRAGTFSFLPLRHTFSRQFFYRLPYHRAQVHGAPISRF